MRVLVTGAGGFLGSRLVRRLAASNHSVIAIGRSVMPATLSDCSNLIWIERDIARVGIHSDEFTGVDVVFHLAGATQGAKKDELGFIEANEMTTMQVLKACAGRVNRVVLASSQVVYGDANHIGITEDFPLQPTGSAYACSKLNAENWARWFQKKNGGIYIALRLSGFVEGGGIIDYIVDRALRNESIELFSSGTVRRDYLPVEEGIDAFIAALHLEESAGFHVFNIGSGQLISALEVAEMVCSELGALSQIVLSDRPAPQGDFVFDISRATKRLAFRPGNLADAIRNFVRKRQSADRKDRSDA